MMVQWITSFMTLQQLTGPRIVSFVMLKKQEFG